MARMEVDCNMNKVVNEKPVFISLADMTRLQKPSYKCLENDKEG